MNYTPNYHLPQWAETDRVLRTDFNEAMTNTEAGLETVKAVAEELPYVVGTYKGGYGSGEAHPTTLEAGFPPSAVLVVCPKSGRALFVTAPNSSGTLIFNWTDTGVSWYSLESSTEQMTAGPYDFFYILFR